MTDPVRPVEDALAELATVAAAYDQAVEEQAALLAQRNSIIWCLRYDYEPPVTYPVIASLVGLTEIGVLAAIRKMERAALKRQEEQDREALPR